MPKNNRIIDKIRHSIIPKIAPLIAEVNDHTDRKLYVTTDTFHSEYVGCIRMSESEFVEVLGQLGFVPNALSSWKQVRGTDSNETGSYAWRGDPSCLNKYNKWADKQLHVITYQLDGDDETTAVFAHWEYNWLTEPVKHYRGTDFNPKEGVELMNEFLGLYFGSEKGDMFIDRTIDEVIEMESNA